MGDSIYHQSKAQAKSSSILSMMVAVGALLWFTACGGASTGAVAPAPASAGDAGASSEETSNVATPVVSSQSAPQEVFDAALRMLEQGDTDSFRATLLDLNQNHPSYEPASRLARWLDAPFVLVREIAEQRMKTWLSRPDENVSFTLEQPETPVSPQPPILTKNEYETTAEFEARYQRSQQEYNDLVDNLRNQYRAAVEEYNTAVERYNDSLATEQAVRKERSNELFWEYVNDAVSQVLGAPSIVNPVYDPDRESFSAELVSSRGNFVQNINIAVPLESAREFAQNVNDAKPVLYFELSGNAGLEVNRVIVSYRDDDYVAEFTDRKQLPVVVQRSIKEKPVDFSGDVTILKINKIDYQDPF